MAHLAGRGLSERHALRVVGMSASAYRYQPEPDRNQALRDQIITLAHRHRRYGAGMIYLKLRQAGQPGQLESAKREAEMLGEQLYDMLRASGCSADFVQQPLPELAQTQCRLTRAAFFMRPRFCLARVFSGAASRPV